MAAMKTEWTLILMAGACSAVMARAGQPKAVELNPLEVSPSPSVQLTVLGGTPGALASPSLGALPVLPALPALIPASAMSAPAHATFARPDSPAPAAPRAVVSAPPRAAEALEGIVIPSGEESSIAAQSGRMFDASSPRHGAPTPRMPVQDAYDAKDPGQKSLIKYHGVMTRGRGLKDYIRILDGNSGGAGAFARDLEALKRVKHARWLDSGGGEGMATAELATSPGFEDVSSAIVSYKTSAKTLPNRSVLAGRFLQDIPQDELGLNHLVTDVMGVLAYTHEFFSDMKKLYSSLAPNGRMYVYLGSSRQDFYGKKNIVLSGGRAYALGDYLKTIPGLDVELVKTPLYDAMDRERIGEVWNARITRHPDRDPKWPEIETVYFREGDPSRGEIVPRRVFAVKGDGEVGEERAAALADAARRAVVKDPDRGESEFLFDKFRGWSGLSNPLLWRLGGVGRGGPWTLVSPRSDWVGRDLERGPAFTDRAFPRPAQKLMEVLARRARVGYESSVGPGRIIVVDDPGAAYAFDRELRRWIESMGPKGELWIALGPAKEGVWEDSRVLTSNGRFLNLADWMASIPGLRVETRLGHRLEGNVHQQWEFARVTVRGQKTPSIPMLRLVGVDESRHAAPFYREAGATPDGAPMK